MREKLIFATLSALIGIIGAFEGIWILFIFLLFLLGLLGKKKINKKLVFILLFFFVFYYFVSYLSIKQNTTTISPSKTHFFVQFSDDLKIDGDHLKSIVTDVETQERLILTYKIPTQMEKEEYEDHILMKNICSVTGNLEEPSTPRNLNAFNYKEYLKQEHILWEIEVTYWSISSCTQSPYTMLDQIKLMRLNGISQIEKNFPKELAPLAAALIFGTRELLADETLTSYQRLGVIHLISISGLHVALLVGIIFYLGIRLGAVREKLSKILILVLPLYAILTGATPSVNRAVIMAVLILISTNNQSFKLKSIDGMCFSFLILTLSNPYMIYNIGFQLSYIVTFALLLSKSIFSYYPSSIGKMIVTSYISQVSALPLLLYHFFEIPLLSIAANLLFIPLYSFIFLPGFILLFIIQFISTNAFQFLAFFLSIVANYSNDLAEYLSAFSWTRLIPGRPTLLITSLYVLSILISFFSWEKWQGYRIHLILPWLVLCLHLLYPYASSKGEVTFIDVGQGDSILIKLPYNQGNYLIDTGGNVHFNVASWKQRKKEYDVGKDVLIPFLKAKGIHQLDLLILTHGDMDHMGGSFSLLDEIKVKKIMLPSIKNKSPLEKKLIKKAKKHYIEVSYVSAGSRWAIKNNEFFILSPLANFNGDKNEGSIVIYSKIGGIRWLFTGDLGIEGEKEILEKHPNLLIDVLKVGHHGSRNSTSQAFIKQINPKYSIISVGKKNGFGHPHNEVLKILEEEGSKILRTDTSGGITYYFKGERGTFLPTIP